MKFLSYMSVENKFDLDRSIQQAIPIVNKLDPIKQLQAKTAAELDALLPSILDKAFKGE